MSDPTEEISEIFVTHGAFFKIDLGNMAGGFIEKLNESLIESGHLDDLSPYNQARMKESMDNHVDEMIAKHAGKTFQADPFGISVGKDFITDEDLTTSYRLGFGGQDGVRPELFIRTENHFSVMPEDGSEPIKVTDSFLDIGYLNAEISSPGARGSLYSDPLSAHQRNVEYVGARMFNQHFTGADSELYSTTSGGVTMDGTPFLEGTLAYSKIVGDWDLTSAAQASYSDHTPQLDVRFSAERYFDIPAISGRFNAAVQGTLTPDQELITGATHIDLRPEGWKNSDNWFEKSITASFNTKAQWDGQDIENEYSVGVYADVPLGRVGVEHDIEDGSTAAVFKAPF